MARVTEKGVETLDLAGHFAALQTKFRERFGSDLVVDSESPQGQIIGITAEVLAEIDEAIVQVANSFSPRTAQGAFLDDLHALANVPRIEQTHTTFRATLQGQLGARIPAGAVVRSGQDEFKLRATVRLEFDGNLNTGMGTFEAVEGGAISIPKELDRVSLIPGWEKVLTIPGSGILGRSWELDADYRERGRIEVARNSSGSIPALRAALSRIGVTRSKIIENDDKTMKSDYPELGEIPAHSIVAIVERAGAITKDDVADMDTSADIKEAGEEINNTIAQTIADYKALGVGTYGDSEGTDEYADVEFQIVKETPVTVAINAKGRLRFGTIPDIKVALADYFNAHQDIGDEIDAEEMRVPIYAFAGIRLETIAIKTKTNDGNNAIDLITMPETNTDVLYTLNAGDVEIMGITET